MRGTGESPGLRESRYRGWCTKGEQADKLTQINTIKPIYEDREFEENQQKNSNVLSYRRSMSVSDSRGFGVDITGAQGYVYVLNVF